METRIRLPKRGRRDYVTGKKQSSIKAPVVNTNKSHYQVFDLPHHQEILISGYTVDLYSQQPITRKFATQIRKAVPRYHAYRNPGSEYGTLPALIFEVLNDEEYPQIGQHPQGVAHCQNLRSREASRIRVKASMLKLPSKTIKRMLLHEMAHAVTDHRHSHQFYKVLASVGVRIYGVPNEYGYRQEELLC